MRRRATTSQCPWHHKIRFWIAQGAVAQSDLKEKDIVDDKAKFIDWLQRSDIKAELKVEQIIQLADNGFPPIDSDEVYQEIFEQAKDFKMYQGQRKNWTNSHKKKRDKYARLDSNQRPTD